MSFGKNVIPRRAHKERSQPSPRLQKHGLLEKKGDYKLRAKKRNQKALRIKLLREKAAFRNPDEFYYGMIRASTAAGRAHKVRNVAEAGAVPLAHRSAEHKLLASSQDAAYVAVKAARASAMVQRMRKGLHFVSDPKRARASHVVFVDDHEEYAEFQQRQHDFERNGRASALTAKQQRRLEKERGKAYRHLDRGIDRSEKLNTVLRDIQYEKALVSKGTRTRVRAPNPETGAPPIFRWRQERRR